MGPLQGYTVIELAGIGPSPFAGMLLADMGARVIRIERSSAQHITLPKDVSMRGKDVISLDLKDDAGKAALWQLLEKADVLIEGYRPGVLEKLGFAPETCWEKNPRLVIGRMTGWGQDGPLAKRAGHDLNYIAIAGVLNSVGVYGEKPTVPLNLIGDMGGGALFLVVGVLAALLERQQSGQGQVVDAAMVDGASLMMWMMHSFKQIGRWSEKHRGANLLDGGAPFYDTYETADGKYLAVGAIEAPFLKRLLELANGPMSVLEQQFDVHDWPKQKAQLAELFKSKTQAEWCDLLEHEDTCVSPIMDFVECQQHPHNVARKAFIEIDGFAQPAPAPRFSRTPSRVRHGQQECGQNTQEVLSGLGFTAEQIATLQAAKVLK